MAHAPHPSSPRGFGEAGASGHASAEDEYLVSPPGTGHEHSDTNVWIIVKFGFWLAISAIVIHLGLGLLFGLFVKRSEETVKEFPLASQEHRLPTGARLQQFPENEFQAFRLHEDAVLHQYGWVSREAGMVRIPIEEAMKLTVERGLPVRAQQPTQDQQPGQAPPLTASPQAPGLMPADSSAGRTMERRRQ